ncbi:Ubiquitin carboxyl-terminal hydrolase 20 [Quaeritorhiza haematococci]|nr:Ubiquitin carboxyl-terminal hydrolase 20 [Quaeritorhiza haematococci]
MEQDLWICLHPGCTSISCGRTKNRHAFEHHKRSSGHNLTIKVNSLELWCYGCRKWVGSMPPVGNGSSESTDPSVGSHPAERAKVTEVVSAFRQVLDHEVQDIKGVSTEDTRIVDMKGKQKLAAVQNPLPTLQRWQNDISLTPRRAKERCIPTFVKTEKFYFVSNAWLTKWRTFLIGNAGPPVGGIDNRSIFGKGGRFRPDIRPETDIGFITETSWRALHGIYGGGPEVSEDLLFQKHQSRNDRLHQRRTGRRSRSLPPSQPSSSSHQAETGESQEPQVEQSNEDEEMSESLIPLLEAVDDLERRQGEAGVSGSQMQSRTIASSSSSSLDNTLDTNTGTHSNTDGRAFVQQSASTTPNSTTNPVPAAAAAHMDSHHQYLYGLSLRSNNSGTLSVPPNETSTDHEIWDNVAEGAEHFTDDEEPDDEEELEASYRVMRELRETIMFWRELNNRTDVTQAFLLQQQQQQAQEQPQAQGQG